MSTLSYLLYGLVVTAGVFVGGTLLTMLVGLVAGLLRFGGPRWLRPLVVVFVEVFRGTSALVQLFWFYYVLPQFGIYLPAWQVGILVLGLHGGAYGAEIVRGALQAVPRGQWEVSRALNLSPVQTLITVQLPQAIPAMLPPAGNLGIEVLKLTALTTLIDLHELMYQAKILSDNTPDDKFTIYLLVMALYFLLAMAFILPLRRMECREFRLKWGTRLQDFTQRLVGWIPARGLFVVLSLGAIAIVGIVPIIWWQGFQRAQMLGQDLWNWALAWEILPLLLQGLQITLIATAGGYVLALVLGLIWAGLQRIRSLTTPLRWALEFVRSTPLLTQLMLVFYGLLPLLGWQLPPLLVGISVLGLHISTYTAEVYRAGLEDIPRGQTDAARALGLSPLQTFIRILLPQAVPRCVPALGNYLLSIFKETPLLSVITVGEMLAVANQVSAVHFRSIEAFTLVGLIFMILALLSACLIRLTEKALPVRH